MNDDTTAAHGSGGHDPPESNSYSPKNGNAIYRSSSEDGIMKDVTFRYLSGLDPNNYPEPYQLEDELISEWRSKVKLHNACIVDREDKYRMPTRLTAYMIAEILIIVYRVKHLLYSEDDDLTKTNIFGFFCSSGSHKGTYVTSESEIARIARLYNGRLTKEDIRNIFQNLSERAPIAYRCSNPDFVPVNNGIYDYKSKKLLDFSPDHVFTSKSKVNYNPLAKNIVIHNDSDGTDWDVESWIKSLSDDPEIVNLIWQVLGAILRCNVKWNKAAFFMSSQGNNGKGTLCELMRELCGKGTYVTLPLSDFGKDFMLSPLEHASSIITDENDFEYLDKVSRLKAVITNDPINVNRKHLIPITIRFNGFMIQCLNDEAPRFKDKTSSLYRRILPIPFTKCFTGSERRYIKSDYVHRAEVLEYVMYKALNISYEKLSEPSACLTLLEGIKISNDPIRQFVDEVLPKCRWKLLPYSFLYDLYKAWKKESCPNGTLVGSRTFNNELRTILVEIGGWKAPDYEIKVKGKMEDPEPLIFHYQLQNWYNPLYKGPDPEKIGLPALKQGYRGIVRL